jgi:signal transduction histidine kinase
MAGKVRSAAEQLARLCAEARAEMARSGRLLHDEAGPLLSAAGLKLGLLRMDHPAAESGLKEVTDLLDAAMEHTRQVSRRLNASPVARLGLRRALLSLVEGRLQPEDRSQPVPGGRAEARPAISVRYAATGKLSPEIAGALYDAAAAAAEVALRARASRIRITVSGISSVSIRISDNGRKTGRARALAPAALLARASGLAMDVSTKKDTIVLIRYGLRRSAGG